MGIPGFFSNFIGSRVEASKTKTKGVETAYEKVVVESFPEEVADLEIDANPLVYIAAEYCYALDRYSDNEELLNRLSNLSAADKDNACFKLVVDLIIKLITTINPRVRIGINFDGAVPKAKMEQQRMRRYASALSIKEDTKFDTNCITPGTMWMQSLDSYIRRHLPSVMEIIRNEGVNADILYSSHLVPGEGEHKMFKTIKSSPRSGITVIYGGDADLILMSMISDVNKLYIFRDNDFIVSDPYNKPHENKNIVLTPKYAGQVIMSIDKLKDALEIEMNYKSSAVEDFVFAASLLGNDFIPRQASFMDLKITLPDLVKALQHTRSIIIDPNTRVVNWVGFIELLDNLLGAQSNISNETQRIVKVNANIGKGRAPWRPYNNAMSLTTNTRSTEELSLNFRKTWYNNILYPNPQHEVLLDAAKEYLNLDFSVSQEDITEMVLHYLSGLNWTHEYYNKHSEHVTWSWYYPYAYAPLLSDIRIVLTALIEGSVVSILDVSPVEGERRFTPLEQMVYVLPPASARHAPAFLHPMWSDSSPLVDVMPFSFVIDQDMEKPHPRNTYYAALTNPKNTEWKGRVILPYATSSRIINAVRSLSIPQGTLSAYEHKKSESYSLKQRVVDPFTQPYSGQRGDRRGIPFVGDTKKTTTRSGFTGTGFGMGKGKGKDTAPKTTFKKRNEDRGKKPDTYLRNF